MFRLIGAIRRILFNRRDYKAVRAAGKKMRGY